MTTRRLRPVTGTLKRSLALLSLLTLAGAALMVAISGVEEPVELVVQDEPTPLPSIDTAAEGSDDASSDVDGDVRVPLPLVTYELLLSRDPFDPVVPEDPVTVPTSPTPPTSPTSPTSPTDPGDPGGQTGGNGTSGDQGPACSGSDELVCDGRVLTLTEIASTGDDRVAVIQVDDATYEVQPGEVFATSFELLSFVADDCVLIAYGDIIQRLCVGESVLK